MARVVYDQEIMGLIGVLSKLIKVPIKDCFKEEEIIYCIVEKGFIGKAIGKGAVNIKRVNQVIKKKVRFVEFADTAVGFVHNLIYPVRAEEIRLADNNIVEIVGKDRQMKSILIGRDAGNLKFLNRIVKRFFDVEIKVV